jgi:hypothetical protein
LCRGNDHSCVVLQYRLCAVRAAQQQCCSWAVPLERCCYDFTLLLLKHCFYRNCCDNQRAVLYTCCCCACHNHGSPAMKVKQAGANHDCRISAQLHVCTHPYSHYSFRYFTNRTVVWRAGPKYSQHHAQHSDSRWMVCLVQLISFPCITRAQHYQPVQLCFVDSSCWCHL